MGPGPYRSALFASAAVAAFATMHPWVRVRFDRLFGEHWGPPGWQSSAGFTCLTTCALVVIMTMAETTAKLTHQAVRPGSAMLVIVCTLTMLLQWWDGPGHLRGVTASWTFAFWATIAATPALLAACLLRWQNCAARTR